LGDYKHGANKRFSHRWHGGGLGLIFNNPDILTITKLILEGKTGGELFRAFNNIKRNNQSFIPISSPSNNLNNPVSEVSNIQNILPSLNDNFGLR